MNFITIVLVTAFSAFGDYLLKIASERKHSFTDWHFIAGMSVFAATAFGWVLIMKSIKLSEIGAIFSISYILMLVGIGVVFFKERLNWHEWIGIGLAVLAAIILRRFS